ncbi:MAG: hypothetical protein RSA41_07035 [Christensenella sp.]
MSKAIPETYFLSYPPFDPRYVSDVELKKKVEHGAIVKYGADGWLRVYEERKGVEE